MSRGNEVPIELQDHIVDGPLGKMLHHPLMIEIVFNLDSMPEEMVTAVVDLYLRKKADVEKAIDQEDWERFVFLHERPYRLEALLEAVWCGIDPQDLWPLIGRVWQDSENIFEQITHWYNLWTSESEELRPLAMSEQERMAIELMPQSITVYRGSSHSEEAARNGLSWTINRDRAVWFANRFTKNGYLATGQLNKADIWAFFDGRDEYEVVAHPQSITDTVVEQI